MEPEKREEFKKQVHEMLEHTDSVSMPVKLPDIDKLADTTDITIENLSCPKCNREFSGFGYVKRHMSKIHNVKCIFFKCQCGKKFDDSLKLKKHVC